MRDKPRTFLISVRPQWASAFFLSQNPKSIELRKANFGASIERGDSIVIYATQPVGAILGTLTVTERISYQLCALWEATRQGRLACITEAEFRNYYGDAGEGVGIWLENAQLFKKPIALSQLREIWGGWQPPQQLQRLSRDRIRLSAQLISRLQPVSKCYVLARVRSKT